MGDNMRLKDYIAQLSKEDYEEIFANMDQEEKKYREFLKKLDDDILMPISIAMNDAFQLPMDNMSPIDFLVELYKCQRADFYFDGVEDAIEQINIIMEDLDAPPSASSVIYL